MRPIAAALALAALLAPVAQAQMDPPPHHHPTMGAAPQISPEDPWPARGHGGHGAEIGPTGSTYDLRWIDAMLQHHTGALRMGEFVFDIGVPGVGSLAKDIWRDQAQEIKAMRQWRKAWYPEAPVVPVALKSGGDPNAMEDLIPMGRAQIQAMQMRGTTPTRENRGRWFLEGMLHHHGGALIMAHDALQKSTNPTIRRLARTIILAQRKEILQIRRMLRHDGWNKSEYHQYDSLFSLN